MRENLDKYLQDTGFEKQLKKLNKKLKYKSIIIYGAGLLFKKIKEKYDLSKLNIIGVSDVKFTTTDEENSYLGYKIIPREKIEEYKPDYVLVGTIEYIDLIEFLENQIIKDKTIKIRPLVNQPILMMIKNIFK